MEYLSSKNVGIYLTKDTKQLHYWKCRLQCFKNLTQQHKKKKEKKGKSAFLILYCFILMINFLNCLLQVPLLYESPVMNCWSTTF